MDLGLQPGLYLSHDEVGGSLAADTILKRAWKCWVFGAQLGEARAGNVEPSAECRLADKGFTLGRC